MFYSVAAIIWILSLIYHFLLNEVLLKRFTKMQGIHLYRCCAQFFHLSECCCIASDRTDYSGTGFIFAVCNYETMSVSVLSRVVSEWLHFLLHIQHVMFRFPCRTLIYLQAIIREAKDAHLISLLPILLLVCSRKIK